MFVWLFILCLSFGFKKFNRVFKKATTATAMKNVTQKKKLMNMKTMAVRVRYNSWYISLPSSAKRHREKTNSALFGEREPRRLILLISVSNLPLCSRFSLVIVLTVINKVNDFRVPRASSVPW